MLAESAQRRAGTAGNCLMERASKVGGWEEHSRREEECGEGKHVGPGVATCSRDAPVPDGSPHRPSGALGLFLPFPLCTSHVCRSRGGSRGLWVCSGGIGLAFLHLLMGRGQRSRTIKVPEPQKKPITHSFVLTPIFALIQPELLSLLRRDDEIGCNVICSAS